MAELGVWWNDLTPENIGITVVIEKLGEVAFLHGERIWHLFPPKNGLTMYSVLVVGFVDERISWIWWSGLKPWLVNTLRKGCQGCQL